MKQVKQLYVRFNFHSELCVGCGACVTACADEHDAFPLTDQALRRLYRTERTVRGAGRTTWYSLACLHCDGRACMRACPKGCFSADEATGTVQLDSTACVGCGACAGACPFQGVVLTEQGRAAKCDGCLERLRMGLPPRCVAACPRQAITVDDRPGLRQALQQSLRRALSGARLSPP